MKKTLVLAVLLAPIAVLAQEVAPPPEWALSMFQWLVEIPYVGPALGWFVKVAGFIAAVLTLLSAFLVGLAESFKKVTSWMGMQKAADLVDEWTKKILPFLQYLSMFNVQKKKK
jgi:hypothetical protein